MRPTARPCIANPKNTSQTAVARYSMNQPITNGMLTSIIDRFRPNGSIQWRKTCIWLDFKRPWILCSILLFWPIFGLLFMNETILMRCWFELNEISRFWLERCDRRAMCFCVTFFPANVLRLLYGNRWSYLTRNKIGGLNEPMLVVECDCF